MQPAEHHIVFDWNGTLLDDIDHVLATTNHLLARENVAPVSLKFFQGHYDIPFRQLYHNLGLPPDAVQRLIDMEINIFHDHYEPLATKAGLRAGAVEILAHAKKQNIKSMILSNHIEGPIKTHLRRFGIEPYFADVLAYASRETQFKDMTKGERLRRHRAEKGWTHHRTLIIGDSAEEIEIAHQQDFISVAITGGCVDEERLRAARPDYVIHALPELMPILEKQGFVS